MTNVALQKRLAASILKCSTKRIKIDDSSVEGLAEVKEAITKQDISRLIGLGKIYKIQKQGVSRGRARVVHAQKRKGRKKGVGSRKGKFSARSNPKTTWINACRSQREFAKVLRDKKYITHENYREIYAKIHGGFFRSVRHVKSFAKEKGMMK